MRGGGDGTSKNEKVLSEGGEGGKGLYSGEKKKWGVWFLPERKRGGTSLFEKGEDPQKKKRKSQEKKERMLSS